MITIQTHNLHGIALDWAVAHCENLPIKKDPMGFLKDAPNSPQAGFWIWGDNPKSKIEMKLIGDGYNPSLHWKHAGEIIQRKRISLDAPTAAYPYWSASINDGECKQDADSPLEAAMKSYVESVLGEEIQIPKYYSTYLNLESK
jgi:hypothetical protein